MTAMKAMSGCSLNIEMIALMYPGGDNAYQPSFVEVAAYGQPLV